MKKTLLLSALFFSSTGFAVEPENLTMLKKELVTYHDSGEYIYDISHVVAGARDYLLTRIQKNKASEHPKKLAIVLDIDETCLSNYNLLQRFDFSDDEELVWSEVAKPTATLIPATFKLFKLAEQNQVAVFFITGREEKFRKATTENLRKAGYDQWAHLYLQPNVHHDKTVSTYKTDKRKIIVGQGYDIVLNMGDQYSDLKGGYSDRTYKLPNPYYFVP